jgi:hypothetical protein
VVLAEVMDLLVLWLAAAEDLEDTVVLFLAKHLGVIHPQKANCPFLEAYHILLPLVVVVLAQATGLEELGQTLFSRLLQALEEEEVVIEQRLVVDLQTMELLVVLAEERHITLLAGLEQQHKDLRVETILGLRLTEEVAAVEQEQLAQMLDLMLPMEQTEELEFSRQLP